jgi:hypothetical protein
LTAPGNPCQTIDRAIMPTQENCKMMLCIGYKSKKELAASIGQRLKYKETSFFGDEYRRDGEFMVAHRPALLPPASRKGAGREFFATVTMKDGLIAGVK